MALTLTAAARNAACDAVVDLVDVGTGTAKIQISSTLDDYVGAELLAEVDVQNPAFGAASAGVATLLGVPLSDTSANNTGTAAFMRIVDRDATEIFKGTVTATGGGGDIELDSTSIVSGGTVTITATSTVTMPAT